MKELLQQQAREFEEEHEELWDWIATEIGFDEKGMNIQDGIREFVKLKKREMLEKIKTEKEKGYELDTIIKSLEADMKFNIKK